MVIKITSISIFKKNKIKHTHRDIYRLYIFSETEPQFDQSNMIPYQMTLMRRFFAGQSKTYSATTYV